MIFQNPASISLVSALILIQFLPLTNSQVFPEQYFFPRETDLVAVNGSNSTGRCSNFSTRQTCLTPTSSVLFDGNVPTLSGLDGDMWASQLLTIKKTANTPNITFDFTGTPNYTGVGRVDVVVFNCPEWGISVKLIQLYSTTSTSGSRSFLVGILHTTTSCDSLLKVCISHTVSSIRPVLTLVFTPLLSSNWVHLAEVTFYANGSTCPQDSIITPLSTSSSIIASSHTTAIDSTVNITPTTENVTTMTAETTMRNVNVPSSDTTIVIISIVVTTSIILIIVTIIVILILYKLYSTKHKNHKHNANTDTALGESYTTRQQHNPHSERGHASLCKETGQVYYSTPEVGGGEADPSHQIYNRLTHDTHNTGGQPQVTGMDSTLQGNYEMGEYSTVSNCRQPHGVKREEVSTAYKPLPQLFNVQVDKKKSKKKIPPKTPQPYTPPLDQLYAHVNKKSKKREVSEDPPCESGDVYSVVNKPSAPKIPQKSQLLKKDLQSQNY